MTDLRRFDPIERLEWIYGPVTPRSRAGLPPETAFLRESEDPKEVAIRSMGFRDPGAAETVLRGLYDIGMQPVRAGEAVGDALIDPSLANVTNAGVQTALTAFRPAAAAGVYGLGLLEGARRDAGIGGVSEAFAQKKRKPDGFKPINLPGLTPEQNEQYNEARRRISSGDFRSGAERRTLEADANRLADLSARFTERQSDAEREAEAGREAQRQAEYGRAVEKAEISRERELGRERRFSDTEMGKVWDKTGGFAPALMGIGIGAGSRLATGGGSFMNNYGLPAILGGLGGASANNIPLAYNAFYTEPDNPEKAAYRVYARDLPEGHPQKEEARQYSESLPDANPVRAAASEELYDLPKFTERSIMGGIEGVLGGAFGADAVRWPGRLIEGVAKLPGRAHGAYKGALSEPEQISVRSRGHRVEEAVDLPPLGSSPVPSTTREQALDLLPTQLSSPRAPTTARGQTVDRPEVIGTPRKSLSDEFESAKTVGPSAASDLPPIVIIRSASGRTHHMGDSGKFARKDLYSKKGGSKKASKDVSKAKTQSTDEIQKSSSDPAVEYFSDPDKLTRGMWSGGRVGYARGGTVEPIHAGPLHSTVAGRTDHLPISVTAGSYVLPADIVSALGEGNTNAGMEVVQELFPAQPQKLRYASGGKVPIAAAGGEFVLTPEQVAMIGGGDIDAGHEILDDWVRQTRAHTINTLQSLPGPAR